MRRPAGLFALALLLGAAPLAAQEPHEKLIATDTIVTASSEGVASPAAASDPAASAPTAEKPNTAVPVAVAVAADLSAAPPPLPITLMLDVDLTRQRLTVSENGKTVHVWAISSGQHGYATQAGTFKPQWMSRMWYSRQWDMAPMPHAVFFNGGAAFHGTMAVSALGRPASHGCIRLAPANAARLYQMVQRHGMVQTSVVVHGSIGAPRVARGRGEGRQAAVQRRGYGVVGTWGSAASRGYGAVSRYGDSGFGTGRY